MPTIHFTHPDGSTTEIDGKSGDSVMKTATSRGVSGIVGQCGGSLSCATCHVFVAEDEFDAFPPPSQDEDEMLDCAATERENNSRLSCQLVLEDGMEVHVSIPPEQL